MVLAVYLLSFIVVVVVGEVGGCERSALVMDLLLLLSKLALLLSELTLSLSELALFLLLYALAL